MIGHGLILRQNVLYMNTLEQIRNTRRDAGMHPASPSPGPMCTITLGGSLA